MSRGTEEDKDFQVSETAVCDLIGLGVQVYGKHAVKKGGLSQNRTRRQNSGGGERHDSQK